MIHTANEHGTLIVEFNRPTRKNAFNNQMYDQLSEALQAADTDDLISVILLTGSGGAFSAGNDLDDFIKAPPSGMEAPAFRFLDTLAKLKKPVIAAVNGLAVGIGATLLFHCDLVLAQDSARIAYPFVALGLVPEGAATLLLPQLVGHQRAFEILVLGDILSASEAQSLGLINRVISDQPVLDIALAQAKQLSQLPSGAVLQTKALLKKTDQVLERIKIEADIFAARAQSLAAKEAFAAFFEKRQPDFSGLD